MIVEVRPKALDGSEVEGGGAVRAAHVRKLGKSRVQGCLPNVQPGDVSLSAEHTENALVPVGDQVGLGGLDRRDGGGERAVRRNALGCNFLPGQPGEKLRLHERVRAQDADSRGFGAMPPGMLRAASVVLVATRSPGRRGQRETASGATEQPGQERTALASREHPVSHLGRLPSRAVDDCLVRLRVHEVTRERLAQVGAAGEDGRDGRVPPGASVLLGRASSKYAPRDFSDTPTALRRNSS